jgi:hypothetical protein
VILELNKALRTRFESLSTGREKTDSRKTDISTSHSKVDDMNLLSRVRSEFEEKRSDSSTLDDTIQLFRLHRLKKRPIGRPLIIR